MRRSLVLALVLALAACTAPGPRSGCGSRPLAVANRSTLTVEQFFLGDGTPDGWGVDLLGASGLPGGAGTAVAVPERGAQAVRAVWTTGQAAELRGIDACRIGGIALLDSAIRAE